MRKVGLVVLLVGVLSVCSFAQKAQVFAGYQYLRTDISGVATDTTHVNLNGWDTNVTGLITPHFGVTADFSGAYGKPTIDSESDVKSRVHTFLFGPTVRTEVGKAAVAGHVLFGAARLSLPDSNYSDNAFSMAVGGAVDYNVKKNFAVRVGQFDYILTKFQNDNQNHFRYATGVVFTF
jgi:hypothetical protein